MLWNTQTTEKRKGSCPGGASFPWRHCTAGVWAAGWVAGTHMFPRSGTVTWEKHSLHWRHMTSVRSCVRCVASYTLLMVTYLLFLSWNRARRFPEARHSPTPLCTQVCMCISSCVCIHGRAVISPTPTWTGIRRDIYGLDGLIWDLSADLIGCMLVPPDQPPFLSATKDHAAGDDVSLSLSFPFLSLSFLPFAPYEVRIVELYFIEHVSACARGRLNTHVLLPPPLLPHPQT